MQPFKNFADFKRSVKAGDRLTCENYRYPHLNGERTVSRVQTNALAVTDATGREFWWYFTKAADVKIDGRTVTDVTGGSPNFAYTFA